MSFSHNIKSLIYTWKLQMVFSLSIKRIVYIWKLVVILVLYLFENSKTINHILLIKKKKKN